MSNYRHHRIRRLLNIKLLLCAWLLPLRLLADVSVVASIPPLQYIARAVLGPDSEIRVLLDVQDAPHQFTLSPTDRLALDNAELIIWLGPEFETELTTFLQRNVSADRIVQMNSLAGMTSLPLENGEPDLHLWLDVDNALLLGDRLRDTFARLDPDNASAYTDNLTRFQAQARAASEELGALLAPLNQTPFVVYHDAFQYFERGVGLSHRLALLANPDVSPGMREVLRARQRLAEISPACVILDPEANAELVDTMLDGLQTRRTVIDPMGHGIADSTSAYTDLLRALAEGFRACLNGGTALVDR